MFKLKAWITPSLMMLAGLSGLASSPSALAQSSTGVRYLASDPQHVQLTKKDVLARLKILQDQQIGEAADLDSAIRKQLNDTLKLDVSGDALDVSGRRTGLVTKKIDELNKRRGELNARREIVDRLIFQVDSKWDPSKKLQDFLVQTFIEMASADLADGRDNRLWKEFTYLSMVLREIPETNEDMVSVFEGYLKFSSVLEPKTPAEFLASRNYTNGVDSAQAHGIAREKIGDGVTPRGPIVVKTKIVETSSVPASATTTAETSADKKPYSSSTVRSAPASQTADKGTAAAPKAASTPAPLRATLKPTPAPKAVETAAKAQADTGQVPMPAQPAGQAESPDGGKSTQPPSAAIRGYQQ